MKGSGGRGRGSRMEWTDASTIAFSGMQGIWTERGTEIDTTHILHAPSFYFCLEMKQMTHRLGIVTSLQFCVYSRVSRVVYLDKKQWYGGMNICIKFCYSHPSDPPPCLH